MKLIVLAGLVTVEKAELALELGQWYTRQGSAVTILDHLARMPIADQSIPVIRVADNDLSTLAHILADLQSDVVILAASEQLDPDKLFVILDTLGRQFDTMEMQMLALIDLRTCDCFPTMRERLEAYADTVVMLPYNLEEVLSDVRTT